jgi:hypothetical protein
MSLTIQKLDLYCCMVSNTKDSTLSRLWLHTTFTDGSIDKKGLCWVLEDGIRKMAPDGTGKIHGSTAIGEGSYDVEPVFAPSKFYVAANKYWGHDVALGLANVANFDKIRLHWGASIKDTLGCPLVGLETGYDDATKCFTIRRSREAYYKNLYPPLREVYDPATKKFRVPVKWHTLRNGLLDVNLKYIGQ